MSNKKIGIISPSSNVMGYFPNRTKTGINNLKDIGFDVIFSKKYYRKNDYSNKSVLERVEEINEIIDNDVDIIICSIGGYLASQLLSYIDYEKIKEKKIIFCGFSDITALLLPIYIKTGLIMLYGPTYTVNLCDYGGIDEYTKNSFLDCINKKNINYIPASYSINEYIDWKELENNYIVKKKEKKDYDWHIIKNGKEKGILLGGNLKTLLLILGTEYLPINAFQDCILFIEDCETNINEFCSHMESLKMKGILDIIKGIIIGKFDTKEMNNDIDSFMKEYFKDYNIPIATNLDFGHVFPCLTLPIGAEARLICDNNKVNLKVKIQ